VQLVFKEYKVLKVLLEPPHLLVHKAQRVFKEYKELKVLLDMLHILVHKVLQVFKDLKAVWEHRVVKEVKVRMDSPPIQVHVVHKVL
jgi:hypothetical protein